MEGHWQFRDKFVVGSVQESQEVTFEQEAQDGRHSVSKLLYFIIK